MDDEKCGRHRRNNKQDQGNNKMCIHSDQEKE